MYLLSSDLNNDRPPQHSFCCLETIQIIFQNHIIKFEVKYEVH